MKYTLEITPNFRRQFKKIPGNAQHAVRQKLDALCGDAKGLDIKKLAGREGYRLRVGDYRVMYIRDHKRFVVVALEVGHRREIYQ